MVEPVTRCTGCGAWIYKPRSSRPVICPTCKKEN